MTRSKKINPKEPISLKNFDITINEFGEIISTTPVENINAFLNHHLDDKKIKVKEVKNHSLSEEE